MLYVICLIKSNSKNVTHYRLFDTCSGYNKFVTKCQLRYILHNDNTQVVNAHLQGDDIIIKEWLYKYPEEKRDYVVEFISRLRGPQYILIAKDGYSYKVVDFQGGVYRFTASELINHAFKDKIANCQYKLSDNFKILIQLKGLIRRLVGSKEPNYQTIEDEGTKLRIIDMYTIQRDTDFEQDIHQRYERFTAKALLMYQKSITFDYEIEGPEVKLTKYTGSNRNVIIPSFITSINAKAFWGAKIKAVRLNEGLKVIGEQAFESNRLSEIEIPSTVELIGDDAFDFNDELFTDSGKLDPSRFKLLNSKTILLNIRS